MSIDDFPFNELLDEGKSYQDQRMSILERITLFMHGEPTNKRQGKIEKVMEIYQAAGELEGCKFVEDVDVKKGCKVVFCIDGLKYWVITIKDNKAKSVAILKYANKWEDI